MITGKASRIRAADPDDADAFHAFYASDRRHAALLDMRREPVLPTRDEVSVMLAHPDAQKSGALYVVEDMTGLVRGFCGLRGASSESSSAEMLLLFDESTLYAGAMADDVFTFLCDRAFARFRLVKMLAQCLHTEGELRAFYVAHGFHCEGVQRDVLWSRGQWHALETWALFAAGAADA
jgi:RimJ/RimL family protein N-acetyltransferase